MANCSRRESRRSYPIANGRMVTIIIRDSVVPEDPYLVLVRAKALSLKTGEPFKADKTPRRIKDALIKTSITI
jgi:hypothetical protein